MIKFFKRLLWVLLGLVILLILTPFLLLQFGSESTSTNIKILLNAVAGYSVETPAESLLEQRLIVPEGFVVSLYDGNLAKVRFMAFTAGGDLLATRPREGDVVLLVRDANQDRLPDGRRTLLQGLTRPHGIALWNGW